MKGKKLYSFWLVWPQDKSIEDGKSGEVVVVKEEESDDELEHREEPQVGAVPATAAKIPKDEANKAKDLKSVSCPSPDEAQSLTLSSNRLCKRKP